MKPFEEHIFITPLFNNNLVLDSLMNIELSKILMNYFKIDTEPQIPHRDPKMEIINRITQYKKKAIK